MRKNSSNRNAVSTGPQQACNAMTFGFNVNRPFLVIASGWNCTESHGLSCKDDQLWAPPSRIMKRKISKILCLRPYPFLLPHGTPWLETLSQLLVCNALVGAIVGIHKQRVPSLRKLGVVHGKAMILRGDVTSARAQIDAGLIPQL